jgi:RNA polymerase sigma factor (sigma-70 family)
MKTSMGGDLLRTRTDAEIIASSEHDPRRFAPIFDRHYGAIRRYIHRRVGPDLAEDLASETFVVAFRKRAGYDPDRSDARPWLFGIAANLLRDHHRAERRQLLAYARIDIDPPIGSPFDAADARVDAVNAGPVLARALATLRPEHRETLLLHAWAGLSYEEIADALHLPIGTVRSRISRSRLRLRALMTASGRSLDAEGTEGTPGGET